MGRAISSTRLHGSLVDGLHGPSAGAGPGAYVATTVQDEENMPLMPRVDKKGQAGPEPEEPQKVPSPCIQERG